MKQHFLTDPDKIIIRKDGHELLIMSRFLPMMPADATPASASTGTGNYYR